MLKDVLIVQIQNEVGDINSVMSEVNRMAVFLECEYNKMLIFKTYLYYAQSRIDKVLNRLERLEAEEPFSDKTIGNKHLLEVEQEILQGLLDLAEEQLQNEDLKEDSNE
jgi:DNA-binding SARP family transcriptional activator